MAFSTGNVQRVWMVKRTIFDRVPVRGLFNFQNGNPSGTFVKISPTTCAQPAQPHLNNPHFLFKTVLNRGSGNQYTSASDFAYYQGTTVRVPRAAKVFETNPSIVFTEADKRDW
jgi:hypothetical protein